jgi:hypothetical protein
MDNNVSLPRRLFRNRMPLHPTLRRFYRGLPEGHPCPSGKVRLPAAPLRAIPDKTASARRGIGCIVWTKATAGQDFKTCPISRKI